MLGQGPVWPSTVVLFLALLRVIRGFHSPLPLRGMVDAWIELGVVPPLVNRSVGAWEPTVLLPWLSFHRSPAQIARTVVCFARDRRTPVT